MWQKCFNCGWEKEEAIASLFHCISCYVLQALCETGCRYQLVHETVANNVRKVLPLLPMVGGGASAHVG